MSTVICLLSIFVISSAYPQRPIHPSYYEPEVPTLHLSDNGDDKLTPIADWSTQVPFWPHYPSRTVQALDGVWSFGYGGSDWNLNGTISPDKFATLTPNTTYVPSAFDVKLPGVMGPIGTAFYRTSFNSKIGSDIIVYFAACAWYCQLYFDGVYIGDHKAAGYQPFYFYINMRNSSYHTNNLTHEIFVVSDNRYNHYYSPCYIYSGTDFWWFSGINRNVLIHTLNSPNPSGNSLLRVDSFTNSIKYGTLDVNITFLSQFAGDNLLSFMFIFDGNKNNQQLYNGTTVKSRQWIIFKNVSVPKFKLWSIDEPNLHTLEVIYTDSKYNTQYDSIEIRFGLRRLGIDKSNNNRLTINNKAIRLHGFSRHTMWPDTGSALTLSQIQQDMALIKELSANYIRGSQYGQDQRFLDMCDESGIVIWSEVLGPGVNYTYLNNAYWMKYQTQQINEMLDASINNPSIIIWGLWNEGDTTKTQAIAGYNASANVFRARDPYRFITWASDKETEDVIIGPVADIASFNNYPAWYNNYGNLSYPIYHWNQMAAFCKENYPDKPFIISEYGAGAIYEYNNVTDCKWSQLYQNEVLNADTFVAINNTWVSGVSVWILADFKAAIKDTPNTQCDYYPDMNPPTCAYIDPTVRRPGGLNHKGVVDYWRRFKRSFKLVQDYYINDSVLFT